LEWYFVLIIIIGILIVVAIGFYWWFKSNFALTSTGKISENILCIKNGIANVYIYTKDSDSIIIDAGVSAKGMKKELKKMDIIPDKITDAFITHSDPDHIGGLSVFTKANIYFGADSKVKDLDNYRFLGDNELVMVGKIKVQAISTPGHRQGHTSYLIDNEYLFTGDLIRLKAHEVKPFFKFISSDFTKLLESIRKVAKLENVKMLLTAHTGYTTEFDKAIENWKQYQK
jgi:glyoxylase-like metal-dependent hydrolase (beta-lactamase superfamily II)